MSVTERLPLFMIGVTGTNGKTSVTQWIAHALTRLGRKCALVGTLGNGFPEALVPGPNTTPGATVLQQLLPEFVRQGAQACAMEVSSIGLAPEQGGRHRFRRGGVHQSHARPPRLSRRHGGVRRHETQAVRDARAALRRSSTSTTPSAASSPRNSRDACAPSATRWTDAQGADQRVARAKILARAARASLSMSPERTSRRR